MIVQNYMELDPGYVVMNLKGELSLPGDRTMVLGFMLEGFICSPDERRAHLDQAHIKFPSSAGDFTVGKIRPAWEYKDFSSVMLSGYAPGMVGVHYEKSAFGFDYDKFFTWMSGMRGKFFGHRLEIPVIDGVR